MGLFHCPFGSPFYDHESCVDCGLCIAVTQEEMVAASNKVRKIIKTRAIVRSRPSKIVICGKGGVGKSTIVVLLARSIVDTGYNTIVLDTDESNPGLYRLFGIEEMPKPLVTLLERFAAATADTGANWLKSEKIPFQDIPLEYVSNSQHIKFMMVGKIENPFQGCACSMADITRDIIGKLVLRDKEVILVDSEAGVESFGRGVERNADTILMVVEPNYESMVLSGKIRFMAEGMGINHIWAILNKVPTKEIEKKMIDELVNKSVNVIGTVYYDPQINISSFDGIIPINTDAQDDVTNIVRKLLQK